AKPDPTPEEEEAIELLTLLIERYEAQHYPVPDADPVDVLRLLLDQNGLSQRDIAAELGSESTVSLVLSGKRRLNRDHIARLSQRFHVSPSVFFGGARERVESQKSKVTSPSAVSSGRAGSSSIFLRSSFTYERRYSSSLPYSGPQTARSSLT